jgi:sporulation protein YunB
MVKIFHHLKRRLTKKQKIVIWFFTILFISFLALNYLNTYVNPVIISVSEAKVRALSVRAVNNAIGEVVTDPNLYTDLVRIQEDNSGQIALIQANTIAVNQLNKLLMSKTQEHLETMGGAGVQIPIGSFSGLPVLNGFGPKVTIRLFPVGNVQCSFVSEFKSAGINQTNHKILVNMETKISLVLPLATKQVTTTTQMLICESIIVGKVPETYLNSTSLDEMLNLVPTN